MKILKLFLSIFSILALCGTFSSCEENEKMNDLKGEVLFPKGNEFMIKGRTYTLTWTDKYSSDVRIKLYKSDVFYQEITPSTINSGEYLWTPPQNLEVDNNYKIKIYSNNNDFLFYENQDPFKIIDYCETSTYTDPRDGSVYQIIKIGNQWWFAENFKFESVDGSYYVRNAISLYEKYGKLYTYLAAISSSPPGWHLPSDEEWKTLELYLGISQDDLNLLGYRGKDVRNILDAGGIGFNLKYAGIYDLNFFNQVDFFASYWTSTKYSNNECWTRGFSSYSLGMYRGKTLSFYALSVRYIKD